PGPSHINYLPRMYISKWQYRLVYRDVGSALHRARDIATAFTVIRDALVGALSEDFSEFFVPDGGSALTLLFLAGFVHRDVSTGNIIVVPDKTGKNFRGLLSDFEYAKDITKEEAASHESKTVMSISLGLGLILMPFL